MIRTKSRYGISTWHTSSTQLCDLQKKMKFGIYYDIFVLKQVLLFECKGSSFLLGVNRLVIFICILGVIGLSFLLAANRLAILSVLCFQSSTAVVHSIK